MYGKVFLLVRNPASLRKRNHHPILSYPSLHPDFSGYMSAPFVPSSWARLRESCYPRTSSSFVTFRVLRVAGSLGSFSREPLSSKGLSLDRASLRADLGKP